MKTHQIPITVACLLMHSAMAATPSNTTIRLEAESATGAGSIMQRSQASGQRTRWLHAGESFTMVFRVPTAGQFLFKLIYSNDGPAGDELELKIDSNKVGVWTSEDTREVGATPGSGWNRFKASNVLGPVALSATETRMTVTATAVDFYGIEPDAIDLVPVQTVEPTPTPGSASGEILFQSDDGLLGAWSMGGTVMKSATLLTPNRISDDWNLKGTADLDGDDTRDLIFQNADGTLAVWFMTGYTLRQAAFLNPAQPEDRKAVLVALGDVDGDKKTDLIFQNDKGNISTWIMNGLNRVKTETLGPALTDRNWKVRASGDFNGDGRTDLLFQHADGTLAVWLMNGTGLLKASFVVPRHPGDANWRVAGVADLNNDGQPDLIFQHDRTRMVAAWFMSSGTVILDTATALSPANPGAPWRLVAAR